MSKSATTNNTTKRYDGEGTVNQRKDGRWEYRVSLGKVNGKYAYKSFYAATERELKKLIKQFVLDSISESCRMLDDQVFSCQHIGYRADSAFI